MASSQKLVSVYGNPFTDQGTFERKHMVIVNIPPWLQGKIPDGLYGPVTRFYMNRDMAEPFLRVMKRLDSTGLIEELRRFDGIFNVRKQRGSSAFSMHAFGLAVDWNALDNPMYHTKERARKKGLKPFSNEFDQVWRLEGFSAGIDFSTEDGMHFEYTKHLR